MSLQCCTCSHEALVALPQPALVGGVLAQRQPVFQGGHKVRYSIVLGCHTSAGLGVGFAVGSDLALGMGVRSYAVDPR